MARAARDGEGREGGREGATAATGRLRRRWGRAARAATCARRHVLARRLAMGARQAQLARSLWAGHWLHTTSPADPDAGASAFLHPSHAQYVVMRHGHGRPAGVCLLVQSSICLCLPVPHGPRPHTYTHGTQHMTSTASRHACTRTWSLMYVCRLLNIRLHCRRTQPGSTHSTHCMLSSATHTCATRAQQQRPWH